MKSRSGVPCFFRQQPAAAQLGSQQPLPAPQAGSAQPLPAPQAGSAQPLPAPQAGSQQPLPASQAGSQQPCFLQPWNRPFRPPNRSCFLRHFRTPQQLEPASQAGSQQPLPAPQAGSAQPLPAPQLGSTQPLPAPQLGSTHPAPASQPGSQHEVQPLQPSIRSRSSKPKDWLQTVTPRTSAPRNIIRFIEPHLLCLRTTRECPSRSRTTSSRGCDPRTSSAAGLSSQSVTRGLRLLPLTGCPTGTVMSRGTDGLSAVGRSRLEHVNRFFPRCFACARGVEIAARRACARLEARRGATRRASRATFSQPAGFASRRARDGKVCGCRRGATDSLTAPPRPLHSSNDSGGRPRAIVHGRQTGNSGANPGRPRRCDQASRPAVSGHCDPTRSREGMQPVEPGSQKTYQTS